MVDPSSALPDPALCRTLGLVVAWPLVGLAWQLFFVRPRVTHSGDARVVLRRLAEARVAGVGCVALAAVALAGHVFLLSRLPAGRRVLAQPMSRAVPLGKLDAGLGLLLDTPAVMVCALACLVALTGALVLASRPAPERGWRPWAWLQLALSGALLSFMADGFVAAAFGWSLVIGAGTWLAGWADSMGGVVAATRGAIALGALLLAGALLLTGLDAAGASPTLGFHALSGDLSLVDASGTATIRRALEDQVGPGGVALVAGALLALLGAAAAISGGSPSLAAPSIPSAVAAGATTSAVGPFLLVRLSPLMPSVQHADVVVTAVGAAIVLGAAWHALGASGMRRWLTFAAGAPAGLTCVALGSGGVVPAMGVLVVSGGAAAVLLFVAMRDAPGTEAEIHGLPGTEDHALLVTVPSRLGATFVSMERWVVGSAAAAVGGAVRGVAWAVAALDREAVALPGDLAADGVDRGSRMVVPWLGLGRGSVGWLLLAVAVVVIVVQTLWARG